MPTKQQEAVAVFNMAFRVFRTLDYPLRFAVTCLLGKGSQHKRIVRLATGVAFMGLGVAISHYGEAIFHTSHYWSMFFDGFGYFLHGMGLTPWLMVITDMLDDGELTPE